jgi:hypothetical protein
MANPRFIGATLLLFFGAISFYYAALVFGGCGGAFTLVLTGIGILLIGSAVALVGLLRSGTIVAVLGGVIFVAGLLITHGSACPVNIF